VEVKQNKKFQELGKTLANSNVKFSRDGKDSKKLDKALSPERISEIITRINENFYDREDVLQIIAERILHSPELQTFLKDGLLDKKV
jgi:hypothetical protein